MRWKASRSDGSRVVATCWTSGPVGSCVGERRETADAAEGALRTCREVGGRAFNGCCGFLLMVSPSPTIVYSSGSSTTESAFAPGGDRPGVTVTARNPSPLAGQQHAVADRQQTSLDPGVVAHLRVQRPDRRRLGVVDRGVGHLAVPERVV